MGRVEASYTVELALLLPVILFALFTPIYMGYEMYAQAEQSFVSGWDAAFCAEDIVWDIKFAERILK